MDQRPYLALSEKAPAWRALVDRVAAEEHVDPARLALQWQLESGMRATSPDSSAGARGIMQVLPGTQRLVDPRMQLDPSKPEDSLRMGARYIHMLDTRYGTNTPSSVLAYQGGPGAADAFSADYANASREHPQGMRYVSAAFPGANLDAHSFNPALNADGPALIRAGLNAGPDGVLRLVAQSGPPSMPMGDKWRAAETAMMAAAAAKGDYAGMEHARDFVFQMVHQGTSDALMQAYRSMAAGDGQTAAQYLAKAHAFFPDGSVGRFGVDKSGAVWAQRLDEHDPTREAGGWMKVTPQALQSMLIQTRDPNKFAAMLAQQTKATADLRFTNARAKYYEGLPDAKERIAELRAQGQQQIQAGRDQAQVAREQIRAQERQNLNARLDAIHKEVGAGDTGLYAGVKDPAMRGLDEQIHTDLRYGNPRMSAGEASDYATGLTSGRYSLRPLTSGDYGVVDPKAPGQQPLAVVSKQVGERLASMAKPKVQALPVPHGRSAMPIGVIPRGALTPAPQQAL